MNKKKESKKERIRALEGDLFIARIAVKRQAKMIKKLKVERGVLG